MYLMYIYICSIYMYIIYIYVKLSTRITADKQEQIQT